MNENKNTIGKATKTSFAEMITREEALRIAFIDGGSISENQRKYAYANGEMYYIAINCWLAIVRDKSELVCYSLIRKMSKVGLVLVIKEADDIASDLILNSYSRNEVWDPIVASADSCEDEREVLRLLRFLKRMSPQHADVEGLSKFWKIQDRHLNRWGDQWNEHSHIHYIQSDVPSWQSRFGDRVQDNVSHYLLYDIQQKAADILSDLPEVPQVIQHNRWTHCDRDITGTVEAAVSYYRDKGKFSNGKTYEGYECKAEKIADFIYHCDPEDGFNDGFYTKSQFVPLRKSMSDVNKVADATFRDEIETVKGVDCPVWKSQICKVTEVPKSYKTKRIIAQMQSYPAYFLQGALSETAKVVNNGRYASQLSTDDQERNQDAARNGSIDGVLCTVDQSGASDGISSWIGYYILPYKATWYLPRLNPVWVKTNSGVVRVSTFELSGVPVTFIHEDCIFFSIADVATDYVQVFYSQDGVDGVKATELVRPVGFGDDIVIDYRVFETFIDICESFGFQINTDKSFGPGSSFRESCGVEYLNGYPMHSDKWPRTTFECKSNIDLDGAQAAVAKAYRESFWSHPENVASLVSLQHKYYDYNWWINDFLTHTITSNVNSMTTSYPHTDSNDVWSLNPIVKRKLPPLKFEHYRFDYRSNGDSEEFEAAYREYKRELLRLAEKYDNSGVKLVTNFYRNRLTDVPEYLKAHYHYNNRKAIENGKLRTSGWLIEVLPTEDFCRNNAIPMREEHFCISAKETERRIRKDHKVLIDNKKRSPIELNPEDLERWLYMEFLSEGPSYEDKLSELLHVSQSRRSLTYYYTETKFAKTYVYE